MVLGLVLALAAGAYYLVKNRTLTGDEYFTLAATHLAEGSTSAALIEVKNALQVEPNHIGARVLAGNIYLSQKNAPAAVKEFSIARDLGNDSPEVINGLLRADILQGNYGKVIGTLLSLDNSRLSLEQLLLRAQAHLGLGNRERAEEDLNRALVLDPDNSDARRALTQIALQRDDTEEAQRQIALFSETDPGNAETLVLSGEVSLQKGEVEAARVDFEAALKRDPQHLVARLGLVRTLLALNLPDQALEHIDLIEKANPRSPVSYYLRGIAQYLKRDFEAAQVALSVVLGAVPDHAPSLLLSGGIHYQKGEFDLAAEKLARHVTLGLPGIRSRLLLGAVYLNLREYDKAKALLEAVVEEHPDNPQALAVLGSVLMAAGDFENATATLQQAADLQPDAASIHTQLGLSRLVAGETELGIQNLESAAEMDQGSHRADYLLVMVHLRQNDFETAKEIAQKLAEVQPANPIPLNLQGAAYEGLGDVSSAKAAYEAAVQLNPAYHTAMLNLARLDVAAGEFGRAEERYRSIIASGQIASAHYGLSKVLERTGRVQESLEQLELAAGLSKRSLPMQLDLARAYSEAGDALRALAVLEQARAEHSDDARLLAAVARAELAAAKFPEAAETLTKLSTQQPRSVEILFQLGLAQARSEQRSQARETLGRLLVIAPQHEDGKNLLGRLALSERDLETALRLAKEIQIEHPQSTTGDLLEGDVLSATGDYESALMHYQHALELRPNGATIMKIAGAYSRLGEKDKATELMESWLSREPTAVQMRVALASIYQEDGKSDQALNHYEHVLIHAPNQPVALNNLAWIYHQRGDQRAMEFAQKAYEVSPDRPEITDTYGWFLIQSGKIEQGLTLITKARSQAPGNPDIWYHYAVGLVEAGDKATAKTELVALLEANPVFSQRAAAESLLARLE